MIFTGSLSRSSSSTERNELTVGISAPRTSSAQNLTCSFAQTELPLHVVAEETAKDMIDSGMQASGVYKERNISVTEEDEPPVVMGSSSGDDSATAAIPEHKERYSSVSEGDDVMVDAIGGSVEEVTIIGNIMNILSFNSMK